VHSPQPGDTHPAIHTKHCCKSWSRQSLPDCPRRFPLPLGKPVHNSTPLSVSRECYFGCKQSTCPPRKPKVESDTPPASPRAEPRRHFRSNLLIQPNVAAPLWNLESSTFAPLRLRPSHWENQSSKSTMDRHTPPSPAPNRADPLPSGFNELLRHNASASYPHEAADPVHAHSQPGSRYGTPGPQPHHAHGIDTSMAYQQRGVVGDLVRMHPRLYKSMRLTRS
jgi:hypothetical protein